MVETLEIREMLAADGFFVGASGAEDSPRRLAAELETTPIVEYVLRTLAPGTMTPITSILAGRDFDLELLVRDLRNDGNKSRGVYAAYVDLLYDKSLAKVRVPEIQLITNVGAFTGSFTLTYGSGPTTAPIVFDLESVDGAAAFPAQLETALNNMLGPGAVKVSPDVDGYQIRFVGRPDVDQPTLQSSSSDFTVRELYKGDPNLAASFTEAFRSMDLGLNNGLPSPFQNGLSAVDAADRINELGAQVSLTATRNTLVEVTRVRMKAQLPTSQTTANLAFIPSFEQIVSPAHDTLVFADINKNPPENSLVPPSQITALPITLNVNAAIVGTPIAVTVDEDNAAGVAIPILSHVSKNAAAPAGASELRSFTQPVGGVVMRVDPNKTPADFSDDLLKFVPDVDFIGTTTFTYVAGIVGDSLPFDTATNTVTVSVNPVNDAPVNQVPGPQSMLEDGTLAFLAATGNGVSVSDVDADPAGVQVTLTASSGIVTVAAISGVNISTGQAESGSTLTFSGAISAVNAALAGLTFKPTQDFNGSATITITTDDQGNTGKVAGAALKATSTISVNVIAVNDAPVLHVPGPQTVYAPNTLAISPLFNSAIWVSDVDANEDSINVSISASGGIGTLSATAAPGAQIRGNGTAEFSITGSQGAIYLSLISLIFTPSANAADGTLTVVANDQQHNSGPALVDQKQVAIHVVATTGPVGVDDVVQGLVEGQVTYIIDVLANDLTNGTAKPALASFTQPTIGTLVRFDPQNTPNDPTDDKLLYRPPLLTNGQPDLDFFTPAALAPIVFTYVMEESPAGGLPPSQPATVTVRIANVADAPFARNGSYVASANTPRAIHRFDGLVTGGSDIDNEYGNAVEAILTVKGATASTPLLVNTTGGGTVFLNADGGFLYTPASGFQGDDTFAFQLASSLGPSSNIATVTIHVVPAPIAQNDAYTTQEDQTFHSAVGVLANDSDGSGQLPLFALLVANVPASAGSVSLSSDGSFTYIPAANFNTTRPATDPIFFTYKAMTNGRESAVARVFLTVNEVNDNPLALDDRFRAARNNGLLGIDQIISVLGNDTFAPDVQETLTVIGLNGALADVSGNLGSLPTSLGGSVRLEGGQVKYTSPSEIGDDSFTYILGDGRGGISTGAVAVHVAPLYDYGDAPDSYGTTFTSDGPRHIAAGPQLGLVRDEELDAVSSSAATGDDLGGSADEDGLVAYSVVRNAPSMITVNVVASNVTPKLDAWIDYNHDGKFSADEKISDSASIAAGTSAISFTPPATALVGPTFVRFRLSTTGGLDATGLLPDGRVPDGEVEDHVINVSQNLVVDFSGSSTSSQISIRKNGGDVEVFDTRNKITLATSPIDFTRAVTVHGSASAGDQMTVDYAFGGFISVPDGIQLDGGASGSDSLTIQGAAGGATAVRYVSQGLSLGNARLQSSNGDQQNDIQFVNFEPLVFSGIRSLVVEGELNVGGDSLAVSGLTTPINLGVMITLSGGTLSLPSGLSLEDGQVLRGKGTVAGPVSGLAGSLIEATGPLNLGDATSANGFVTQGELRTGGNKVTLLSSGSVGLGRLTKLGTGAAAGTLLVPSGITLDAGEAISGFGLIDTPLDVVKPLMNNGEIQGTPAEQSITLTGYVKGVGGLDQIVITGILSPGASPAIVNYGSVSFAAAAAKLIMEIGGTAAGLFDQINFTGVLKLNGSMQVSFINGFFPDFNDSFSFLNGGSVQDAFSSITLPTLNADKKWRTTLSTTKFVASVVTTHPWFNRTRPHDVDNDRTISASDVIAVINYINKLPANDPAKVPVDAPELKPFVDTDKDNFVTASDALGVINYLNAGLKTEGESAGSGAPQIISSSLSEVLGLIAADIAETITKKK